MTDWIEERVVAVDFARGRSTAPQLDVFGGDGRMVRQVALPVGRRLVGFGRGVILVVSVGAEGLETLERYRSR